LIFETLFIFEFFDDVFDDGLTLTCIIHSEILGQSMSKCFDLNLEETQKRGVEGSNPGELDSGGRRKAEGGRLLIIFPLLRNSLLLSLKLSALSLKLLRNPHQPLLHLIGCLIGKGHRKDARRIKPTTMDQVGYLIRQNSCFTTTRSR
jgi:hypothetical protein